MWECGIEADRMTTLPQRCLNARSFSVNSLSILSRVEKVLILHNNLPDHNIQKDIWRFRSDVNGRNVECFLLWRVHKCSLTCFSFIISLKLPHIMKMLLLISLSVLPIKWRFSFQRNFYLASSPFTAVINRGLFLMRPQKKIISRVLFLTFFCLRMNLYLNFFYENRRSWRELWVKMRFKKKDEAFVFPQSHVSVHDLLIWFFILFQEMKQLSGNYLFIHLFNVIRWLCTESFSWQFHYDLLSIKVFFVLCLFTSLAVIKQKSSHEIWK